MSDDLEPVVPNKAVDLYLEARDDIAETTIETQYYRLQAFLAWRDEEGHREPQRSLGSRYVHHRVWRREGGYGDNEEELVSSTLHGDMATMRAFLRICGEIGAVPKQFYDQAPLPSVDGRDVSKSTVDPDRAVDIVD